MTGLDSARPHHFASPEAQGSSSRRHLHALVSSVPLVGSCTVKAELFHIIATGTSADPTLRLSAELRASWPGHTRLRRPAIALRCGFSIRSSSDA